MKADNLSHKNKKIANKIDDKHKANIFIKILDARQNLVLLDV